jgi:type VI secretion system protein ImpF
MAAMKGAEQVVRRSVLDRLIQSGEAEPRTAAESMRAAQASVLRDIEWLLNTRRIAQPAPAHLTELQESVYHYGLPDISSMSADSPTVRREVLRQVTECIQRFEPRLTSVRVTEPAGTATSRHIRFHVEAMLRLPNPEPIYFDTVLDPATGRFNVPLAI